MKTKNILYMILGIFVALVLLGAVIRIVALVTGLLFKLLSVAVFIVLIFLLYHWIRSMLHRGGSRAWDGWPFVPPAKAFARQGFYKKTLSIFFSTKSLTIKPILGIILMR